MTWLKDRSVSLLLFAGGFAALIITVFVNKNFGVSQAATAEGQLLSGSMAVFVDLALVILGITSGALWRRKDATSRAVGVLTFVLMLACALASVTSVLGFLAAERLSVSKAREKQYQIADARIAAQKAAEKARLDAQIAIAKDATTWMQGTAKDQRGMGKSERKELRKDMIDGINKTITTLGKQETTAAPAPTPMEILMQPDGQAEMIAEMTGINKQTAQLTILAYLSILTVLLKSSFFPIGSYMWKPKELPPSVTSPVVYKQPEAQVRIVTPAVPALDAPAQKMLPAPLPSPLSRPEPSPEGKAVLARIGFPKTPPVGTKAEKEGRDVLGLRWLAYLTAHGIAGQFPQEAVSQLYLEYCAAQNLDPWYDKVAKAELAGVRRYKRYYAWSSGQPAVWTIQLPSFDELNTLLDKAGFPATPKRARAKAEKPAEAAPPIQLDEAPTPAEQGPATSADTKRPFLLWSNNREPNLTH